MRAIRRDAPVVVSKPRVELVERATKAIEILRNERIDEIQIEGYRGGTLKHRSRHTHDDEVHSVAMKDPQKGEGVSRAAHRSIVARWIVVRRRGLRGDRSASATTSGRFA